MKATDMHHFVRVLWCLALVGHTERASACQQNYTEYADFGQFGPSYGYEYTDRYGKWSGVWQLGNYGNPAWWKKDEHGQVVDSKTISQCDTRWKVEENDVVIFNFPTVGTIEFTLHVTLEPNDKNNYRTELNASYSLKQKQYFDKFSVEHVSAW